MKALKSLSTNKYSTCIIKVCGLKVLSNQDQFQRIQKWHYVYLKLEDQSYTSQIPPLVDSKFTFCKNVLCFNFFIVDKKLHKTLFSILHWYIRKLMSIGLYVVKDISLSMQPVNWGKFWKNTFETWEGHFSKQ